MGEQRMGSTRRRSDRRALADRRTVTTILMEHDRRSVADRRSHNRRTEIDRRTLQA